MPWTLIVKVLPQILEAAPHLVDDIEALIAKLKEVNPPTKAHAAELDKAVKAAQK